MDLCMHDTLITGSFACLICGLTTGTKLTNEDVHEGVMHAKMQMVACLSCLV